MSDEKRLDRIQRLVEQDYGVAAITPDDVRWLIEQAAARGVETATDDDAHVQLNHLQKLAREYLANDGSDGARFDAMELARVRKELKAALAMDAAVPHPAAPAAPAAMSSPMRDLVHAAFHLLDDSEEDAATGAISIDNEIAGRDLRAMSDALDALAIHDHEGIDRAFSAPATVAVPDTTWLESLSEVRYLTDDRDLDPDEQHELIIRQSRNHDWYVMVVPKGHRFGPSVRLCTSGGASSAAPGLCPAIADAFRALAASQQPAAEGNPS